MVALAALEMDTCPGCGNRLSVTTATEAEGQYLPDKPSRCHCCDAVEIGVEQAKDNPRPRSLFHSAHRRE